MPREPKLPPHPQPNPDRPDAPRTAISTIEIEAEMAELTRLASDPALISGVYNYCDRWCERCPLTARCLTFKMENTRADRRNSGQSSQALDGVLQDVAMNFAVARRMLEQEAQKRGIDLDSIKPDASTQQEERRRKRQTARQGSALLRAASTYWKSAKALLERLAPEFAEIEEALNTQARLHAGKPVAVAAEIVDALEIVQWYLFFIEVKLHRATASRVDLQREGDDGFPSDADGSAKIALIAIDRSIGAWARLREHVPIEADAMLDMLVQLERLRRAAEREFPHARAFKRAGFD
jgi:hypothetical protein